VILTSLVFLAHGRAKAQLNLALSAPDALAGRWETSDGHGGAVGMNVIISTHIDGAPSSLANQPQYLDEFTVGIYQRTGPEIAPLEFNFFRAGPVVRRLTGNTLHR
jgi:hypothetical protein